MKKEINVLKFKPFRSLIAPAKKGRSVAKIHIISIILCPLRNSYHSIRRKHQVFYWILWPGCCWQPHSTQHCNSLWVLYTTSSSSLSFSYASAKVQTELILPIPPHPNRLPTSQSALAILWWQRLTLQDTSFLSCLSHELPFSQFLKQRIKLQIYIHIFLHCGEIISS